VDATPNNLSCPDTQMDPEGPPVLREDQGIGSDDAAPAQPLRASAKEGDGRPTLSGLRRDEEIECEDVILPDGNPVQVNVRVSRSARGIPTVGDDAALAPANEPMVTLLEAIADAA
jgi:hypothetical protein